MSATSEEIAERLTSVRHAMLDWANDCARIGSIDGEKSEKARADLLGAAAAFIRAQAERVRVLESVAQAASDLEASVAGFLDAYTAFNNDELDEVSMNDAEHELKLSMYAFREYRAALNATGAA